MRRLSSGARPRTRFYVSKVRSDGNSAENTRPPSRLRSRRPTLTRSPRIRKINSREKKMSTGDFSPTRQRRPPCYLCFPRLPRHVMDGCKPILIMKLTITRVFNRSILIAHFGQFTRRELIEQLSLLLSSMRIYTREYSNLLYTHLLRFIFGKIPPLYESWSRILLV